jgi:hypothetical protein
MRKLFCLIFLALFLFTANSLAMAQGAGEKEKPVITFKVDGKSPIFSMFFEYEIDLRLPHYHYFLLQMERSEMSCDFSLSARAIKKDADTMEITFLSGALEEGNGLKIYSKKVTVDKGKTVTTSIDKRLPCDRDEKTISVLATYIR